MAEHIWRRAKTLGWFPDNAFGVVAVRSTVGVYETYPKVEEVDGIEILLDGLRSINCAAALLTGTHVVERVIRQLCVPSFSLPCYSRRQKLTCSFSFNASPADEFLVPVSKDIQVQVINNLECLGTAKRHRPYLPYLLRLLLSGRPTSVLS